VITVSRDTPRLWSVLEGVLMVVTDLHGDNQAYRQVRDRFVDLQAHGAVDGLVFTGDLIHREQGAEDASLDILLDLMRLKAEYGDGILYLLGNHEMPHIYGTTLARGEIEFTPPFETDLQDSGLRAMVRSFLSGLPFYLRTAAGVSIAHAGAAPSTAKPEQAGLLFRWDHDLLLAQAEDYIQRGERDILRSALADLWKAPSYTDLALHYLGISEEDDPNYDDLLRGYIISRSPAYDLLWEALFTHCERQYGQVYPAILQATLEAFSSGFVPQSLLVSGHMAAAGGYQVIAGQQLRVASGQHASKPDERRLLIFDAAQPLARIDDLLEGLLPLG
jgi:hypothetical protein